MAIYQFYLAAVPKTGVISKHAGKPDKIDISIETGYFKSNTNVYWQLAKINSNEVIKDIDLIVKRAEWGNDEFNYNWKTYTDELDNDAWMSVARDGSVEIIELSFRADLREKNLTFLRMIIELANKYDWMLMDREGNLSNPAFDEICDLIKISNVYKFLSNPVKFLSALDRRPLN